MLITSYLHANLHVNKAAF